MRLSDKMTWKQQLLVILMEECGELTQSASKVARFGFDAEKVEELAKEAGDVLCMIDLMVEFGWITQEQLDNRIPIKRNKLKIYSDILR
jgi:NTP pyrophosphatase (non-canonical NTP hydrolase)